MSLQASIASQSLVDGIEKISEDLWPETARAAANESDDDEDFKEEEDCDIEKQLAKEIAEMKRPRRETKKISA